MRERMKGARVFPIRCQYQGRVYPASVRDDSICHKTRAGHPSSRGRKSNSNNNKKRAAETGQPRSGSQPLTPFIINKESEACRYSNKVFPHTALGKKMRTLADTADHHGSQGLFDSKALPRLVSEDAEQLMRVRLVPITAQGPRRSRQCHPKRNEKRGREKHKGNRKGVKGRRMKTGSGKD